MRVLNIIDSYQRDHSTLSSMVDNQLMAIKQTIMEADWDRRHENDHLYQVNIVIARKMVEQLLAWLPLDGEPRETVLAIYRELQEHG